MPVPRKSRISRQPWISPLVRRELRALAYNSVLCRLRLLGVAAPLAVGILIAVSSRRDIFEQGANLFMVLGAITTLLLLLISPVLTADCIGNERREGTLGLLFLTPITARDIIWGKWLSNSISLLVLWLATVPILLVPVVVGGVSALLLIIVPLFQLAVICIGAAAGLLAGCLVRSFPWTWVAGLGIELGLLGFAGTMTYLLIFGVSFIPWEVILVGVILLFGVRTTSALNQLSAKVLKDKWRGWVDGGEDVRPLWSPPSQNVPFSTNYPTVLLTQLQGYLDARPRHPPGEFHFAWLERRRKSLLARKPVDWLFVRHFDPVKAAVSVAIPWIIWVAVYSVSERRPTFPEWIVPPIIAIVASRLLRIERRTGTIELIAITPTGAERLPWSYLRTIWSGLAWVVLAHVSMSLLVYFTQGRFLGPIAPVGVYEDQARFCWSIFGLLGSWVSIPMVAFWATLRAAHGYTAGFVAWLVVTKLPVFLLVDLPGYLNAGQSGGPDLEALDNAPFRWTALLLLQLSLGGWLLIIGLKDYGRRHFVARRMLS